MARLSSKHGGQEQVLNLSIFELGLMSGINAEAMPQNALVGASNFEYDNILGALKSVGGYRVSIEHTSKVTALYYDRTHGVFLFVADTVNASGEAQPGTLYVYSFGTPIAIGQLTGTVPTMFCPYDDVIMIGSGGNLQAFGLTTSIEGKDVVEGSTQTAGIWSMAAVDIECDIVFQRNGRVVVAKTGDDYLKYLGTGDWTNVAFGTEVANDAKFIEVGYKDAGDIVAVVPLSTDIVVFKSNGRIYRVLGEYESNDWTVVEVTRQGDCMNKFSAVSTANDVFFLGQYGFHNLATVQEYGAVKSAEAGKLINPTLISQVDENCRVWHIPTKGQIWLKTRYASDIFMFHYLVRSSDTFGATTKRIFKGDLSDLTVMGEKVYLAIDNKIVEVDDLLAVDGNVNRECFLKTKTFVSGHNYLIKRIDIFFHHVRQGTGSIEVKDIRMPIEYEDKGTLIYGYDHPIYGKKIYGNHALIWERSATNREEQFNYRTKSFDLRIYLKSGSVALRGMRIYYVEV